MCSNYYQTIFVKCAVKINSLAQVIPMDVFASLIVGDMSFAYSGDRLEGKELKLQQTVDKILGWANTNGFRFSQVKTKMHFNKNVTPLKLPELKLAGTKIKKSDCVWFLRLCWDPKLS